MLSGCLFLLTIMIMLYACVKEVARSSHSIRST